MERTLATETTQKIGQEVRLNGWVDTKRDHGNIVFIDLRDRTGIVQVVGGKELKPLKPEDVIQITGAVKERDEQAVNPELETGTVEVELNTVERLSTAQTLPFPINTEGYDIQEDLRLKYRYLDLRRERMARNMHLRFKATQFIRNWLQEQGFIEIETPILTKTTPEGARDFIVPSRLQPGEFYALPQSPQQYKQLLMVSGFERYFQFARCFRDEDPRADRAYGEFTQLDMEMSFVTQEDILQLIESMFTKLVGELFPEKRIKESPWPRIPHQEAMEKYGSDKPDLRENKNDPDELAFAWIVDFPLFAEQSDEDYFHGAGEKARFAPSHHMFTAPHPDDVPLLDSDPLKVRGLQHDLVLNGYEIGGGSIRIHESDIQAKIFDLIGFTEEQKQQFDHMLKAFEYGVPPHGGIAPGLDRFLMAALGEPSLRELIAFPTAASGRTAVVDAPSPATPEQLKELHIDLDLPEGSVYEKLIDTLERRGVEYKHYEHEPVETSEEAAEVRGDTSLHQGAKSMIFRAEDKYIAVIVPADKKVDLKAVRHHLGVGKLKFAEFDRLEEITGCPPGAIPPFGSLMGMKTLVDRDLADNEEIAFNAGRRDRSVKMRYSDYLKIEQPDVLGE